MDCKAILNISASSRKLYIEHLYHSIEVGLPTYLADLRALAEVTRRNVSLKSTACIDAAAVFAIRLILHCTFPL